MTHNSKSLKHQFEGSTCEWNDSEWLGIQIMKTMCQVFVTFFGVSQYRLAYRVCTLVLWSDKSKRTKHENGAADKKRQIMSC